MERSKVLLINSDSRGNYVQGTIYQENLGLGYLSSYLKQNGLEATILDSRINHYSPEQVAADILHQEPKIVGFSLMTVEGSEWVEKVSEYVKDETKRRSPHIALGGYFPSLQPERALNLIPHADSLVLSEGELTFLELTSRISTKQEWRWTRGIAFRDKKEVVINQRRGLITDLDQLPFPEQSAPESLREFAVEGSRGCYCRCSFCGVSPHFRANAACLRWRPRKPSNIVREIAVLRQKHPNTDLYRFIDVDFMGAQKHINRLREFAKELKAAKVDIGFVIDARTKEVVSTPKEVWQELKDVGLVEVYLGVETSSPNIKNMLRKGSTFEEDKRAISTLNDLGINTRCGWLMITPWTTEDDIEQNALALRNLGFARLDKYFQEMNLVPGSDSVELTSKISKIWPDIDNPDYFTYELPLVVDNLRRISRSLKKDHEGFLGRFLAVYRNIERLKQVNEARFQIYKDRLNDLHLSLFMAAFTESKELGVGSTGDLIENGATQITNNFETQLSSLEQEVQSMFASN